MTMTQPSPRGFFVRFQAARDLVEAELVGLTKALTLLRDERAILGWRLAHELGAHPQVSLEIAAETDVDAEVGASMVFVEALAEANLEGERDVFGFGKTVTRA